MAVASPARVTALALLGDQRRRAGRARDLLRGARDMQTLGTKARALATRLVLGVNVASGELDRRIDALVTRANKLEPRVRDALRLAAFELLYLDTPRQVAVSQGVELVRSVQPRAARLANAVLRRVAAERPEVDAARDAVTRAAAGEATATAEELCHASGYPVWLVEELASSIGARGAAAACACALDPAPVYVSCGRPGDDATQVAADLAGAGLAPEPAGLPGSWRLGRPAGLARSGLVASCEVAAADLAAQLVCRVALPASGHVLEVGQGRGTKTLLLARAASDAGARGVQIRGCELVESKVRATRDRLVAAGIDGVASATVFDALRLGETDALPPALAGSFESVLVDAPCSGTGTMRRHPEIPWALQPPALDPDAEGSLPSLQLAMLRAASSRVAPGGSLVYATCSALDVENEGVVAAFLATEEGRGFERASVLVAPGVGALSEEGRSLVEAWLTDSGAFRSVPTGGSHDGHFCARLVRR